MKTHLFTKKVFGNIWKENGKMTKPVNNVKRFKERQEHIIQMHEVQGVISEDYRRRKWEWEHRFDWGVQDNNAASPMEADLDDIREEDDE